MGANIHVITQQMAQQGAQLDQHAAKLKDDAAQLLLDAQQAVKEYMANAQRVADDMLTNAQNESDGLLTQAKEAEENAEHWRRMSAAERKKAKLPPLPAPAERTQPDGEPSTWTGPDGHVWDLTIRYADPSNATWHWAGGFGNVDGASWPLMSRDDWAAQDLPLNKCPRLTPTAEIGTAVNDLHVAPGDPQTAAMPVITAAQNGSVS